MQDSAGYHVHAYPLKALEAFERDPLRFDLVVTDMTMPGMTGYIDRLSGEKASRSGIRRFLQKPMIAQFLAEVIREVLDE